MSTKDHSRTIYSVLIAAVVFLFGAWAPWRSAPTPTPVQVNFVAPTPVVIYATPIPSSTPVDLVAIASEKVCVQKGHLWTTAVNADLSIDVSGTLASGNGLSLPGWMQTPTPMGNRDPGWRLVDGHGWVFCGPRGWNTGEGMASTTVVRCQRCGLWREKPE